MLRVLYFAIFLFLPLLCLSQKEFTLLDSKLKGADSVFIISYYPCLNMCGLSYQLDLIDSSHGEMKFHNIVERVRIQDTALERLREVLVSPIKPTEFVAKCLAPNHGILIYSGKEKLYLDLSFSCKQYSGSLELEPYNELFDDLKWEALFQFFYQKGIRYAMGDPAASLKAWEASILKKGN